MADAWIVVIGHGPEPVYFVQSYADEKRTRHLTRLSANRTEACVFEEHADAIIRCRALNRRHNWKATVLRLEREEQRAA